MWRGGVEMQEERSGRIDRILHERECFCRHPLHVVTKRVRARRATVVHVANEKTFNAIETGGLYGLALLIIGAFVFRLRVRAALRLQGRVRREVPVSRQRGGSGTMSLDNLVHQKDH